MIQVLKCSCIARVTLFLIINITRRTGIVAVEVDGDIGRNLIQLPAIRSVSLNLERACDDVFIRVLQLREKDANFTRITLLEGHCIRDSDLFVFSIFCAR